MRRNGKSTEPVYVLDDGVGRAAEGIRRARHVERDEVTRVGADFHAIQTQHAVDVFRRIRRPRAVAVIRQDDEPQAGAGRRGSDVRLAAVAVGSGGVDVVGARDRARGEVTPPVRIDALGRRRSGQRKQKDADCNNCNQRPDQSAHTRASLYLPPSARRTAALSVRSHVNSGSVRPKWPNAAVFL
jgi:hypothetical protein